jgi:hypothetical protein
MLAVSPTGEVNNRTLAKGHGVARPSRPACVQRPLMQDLLFQLFHGSDGLANSPWYACMQERLRSFEIPRRLPEALGDRRALQRTGEAYRAIPVIGQFAPNAGRPVDKTAAPSAPVVCAAASLAKRFIVTMHLASSLYPRAHGVLARALSI